MARRLAAILAADVVGYSRLMGADENGTLERLKSLRKQLVQPKITAHGGRIVKLMGDGLLAEFPSVVEAVQCAVEIQSGSDERALNLPEDQQIRLRIGINLGDIIVDGSDIYGDGVNVAARLEALADPGGICISGPAFDTIEGKLDLAFEDIGEQQVKNIAKPVRAYRLACETTQGRAPARPMEPPQLPDKPSIAVLPFENISGDPEQEYFADGMVEEIITALSHMRWLFVIARNSSFTYKGRAVDVKQVGRELGVRYVLEGSVRKAGNRVRITAQLIEAATGAHLWAERYDGDFTDAFAVQDEITDSVVGAIEPELLQVERQRAARKNPENMDAWDHYLRGLWRFYHFNPEDHAHAERLMRRAIELDPAFAQGHIGLARVLNGKVWFGWSADVEADRRDAYAAARRAVELDDKDAYGHYILSWICLLMREQENALTEAQKSIDLTPNFALGYIALGIARVFLGRFDQVAEPFERARRLSPHEPLTFFFATFLALAEYHLGHYQEAARIARLGIAIRPFHSLYRVLAASYGQLGRADEAGVALAEMRRFMPKVADSEWDMMNCYLDPAHRAHFVEGLRKAGLN